MKANEYKCAICGGIFEKGWTDEEAIKEMKDNFGKEMTVDDCGLVCDDCYNEMFPSFKEATE